MHWQSIVAGISISIVLFVVTAILAALNVSLKSYRARLELRRNAQQRALLHDCWSPAAPADTFCLVELTCHGGVLCDDCGCIVDHIDVPVTCCGHCDGV